MTNNEKAKELGDKFTRQYHHNNYPEFSSNSEFVFSNKEIEKACNEMANWKDQQIIEKACEWLEENIYKYNDIYYDVGGYVSPEFYIEEFMKDFKKAMEE